MFIAIFLPDTKKPTTSWNDNVGFRYSKKKTFSLLPKIEA